MSRVTVAEAQQEVRRVFLHGAVGQTVAGFIWLAAALAGSAGNVRGSILTVVAGGAFIFPITQLILRLMRRRATLSRGNPLNGLALQIAVTVPLALPVAGAAALYRIEWFFPAVMVIVGGHYLPFVFLYGMPAFGVLGGALIGAGTALAFWTGNGFATGAWITSFALLAFGVWAAVVRGAGVRAVGTGAR